MPIFHRKCLQEGRGALPTTPSEPNQFSIYDENVATGKFFTSRPQNVAATSTSLDSVFIDDGKVMFEQRVLTLMMSRPVWREAAAARYLRMIRSGEM